MKKLFGLLLSLYLLSAIPALALQSNSIGGDSHSHIAVATADANVDLTSTSDANGHNVGVFYYSIEFTGALTADRTVTLSDTAGTYEVWNNTTGSHNLIFDTVGGTATVTVPMNAWAILVVEDSDADVRQVAGAGIVDNATSTALTIDSGQTALFSTDMIVGSSSVQPDGILHAYGGNAGSVTAPSFTILTVENSSSARIALLTPDAAGSTVNWGSPSDNDYADIFGFYNSGSPYLAFRNSGAERFSFTVGAQSLAAAVTGRGFRINLPDTTITGAATAYYTQAIEQVDITAATAQTITTAATLYIAGAPTGIGAGPATITNAYGVFVDAGISRFDGDGTHVFELPADATDPTSGGGAATGRIPVKIGGSTFYLAYY